MSINDDAVSDLENDGEITDDVIKTPADVAVGQQDVTVVVKTDEIEEEPTKLDPTDWDQLLKADVQFQVLTDKASTVEELESIQDELIAAESIDKKTAKYLGEYFPTFLSGSISLEQFSQAPSKINYQLALKQIRLAIEDEKSTLLSDLIEFTETTLNDSQLVLQRMKELYLPDLIRRLTEIQDRAQQVLAHITDNKDTVIAYQDDGGMLFIDIARADIRTFAFHRVRFSGIQSDYLNQLLVNIQKCLTLRYVASLVVASEKETDLCESILDLNAIQNSTEVITFTSVVKFFASNAVTLYFETLLPVIDERLSFIEQYKSTVAGAEGRYEIIEESALLKNKQLTDLIELSAKQVSVSLHVGNLLANISGLFNFLLRL